MQQSWSWWLGFTVFVLAMLTVDLGVLQRRAHAARLREALAWVAVCISAALLFNLGIWLGWIGSYEPGLRSRMALEFLTAYLIEESLSVDNLFVFAVIFTYFAVPAAYQHRVLFFGILGALVFRGIFIFGGLWLIQRFTWTIYVFAAFLIFTGIKLAFAKDKEVHPEHNPVLRLARAVLPLSPDYVNGRFLARISGRLVATPLLPVLLLVETTDVMFALDSIPAVIAISKDPFIVYTSNVFAILGLRALYFVLAAFLKMFRYLSYGLAVLLVFTGLKMLAEPILHRHLPVGLSLAVITAILALSIVASVILPDKSKAGHPGTSAPAGKRTG